MNFIRPIRLLALAIFLTTSVFTAVRAAPSNVHMIPLAGITNDRNQSVSYLKLMVSPSDAAVRGIYVQTVADGARAKAETDVRKKASVFWTGEIESKSGVVLRKGQGRNAILLQGTINSQAGKGDLVIKYLNNGLLMRYSRCKVELRKSTQDRWALVNAYNGRKINHIVVKTWFLGISTLQNVCPSTTANRGA